MSLLPFESKMLPVEPELIAPDGSNVRTLLRLKGGDMAHFELAPGKTSTAICNRSIEELWYILSGEGEIWRQADGHELLTTLEAGLCISIPLGTKFQFRSSGSAPLKILGVAMPPFPGVSETCIVEGRWTPEH